MAWKHAAFIYPYLFTCALHFVLVLSCEVSLQFHINKPAKFVSSCKARSTTGQLRTIRSCRVQVPYRYFLKEGNMLLLRLEMYHGKKTHDCV